MKPFVLLYSFIVIVFPVSSFAEPQGDLLLTLSDFLEKAKANDPQAQTIIAERLRTKYLLDLNLPSREVLLSVQNEYGFTRNEDATSVLSAVISKPFLETGTVVSVGKTMTERPDRTEDVSTLRVEQALYRNAFGNQIKERKRSLETQKDVIELQVVESYEDYVQQMMHSYLDLTLTYLNFKTAEKLYKESLTLLNNVKKRKQKNIATQTDLNRAELQLSLRRENKLQSISALETLSRGVLRILGDKTSKLIVPETMLNLEDRLSNVDIDIEKFLIQSRSRIIYDKQELAANVNLSIAKENLKPSANLLLGFNIDNSRRFSTAINREEAVIGVNVDIPFDNSAVEAQIKEANYLLLKSKLAKKGFEEAIKESLYVIKNKILRQKEQLAISKKKRDLAASIVIDQTKRYLTGRVTLENLIEDRNIQAQYEFSYQSELTNMNKLIIQWLGLTDQLIDKI